MFFPEGAFSIFFSPPRSLCPPKNLYRVLALSLVWFAGATPEITKTGGNLSKGSGTSLAKTGKESAASLFSEALAAVKFPHYFRALRLVDEAFRGKAPHNLTKKWELKCPRCLTNQRGGASPN